MAKQNKAQCIGGQVPTNDAKEVIERGIPYVATVTIQGTSDILFHRWSCEDVEAKDKAAKGSKSKKTDNLEAYIYRNDKGEVCIPGEYLRMSIIGAAKFKKDPRSPRKSMMDLYKASVISLTNLASLGKSEWDYNDKRRVLIQRNGINRIRPAFREGWRATFDLQILLPEYISPDDLHDSITTAGKLIGLADFRPSYGRFHIVEFKVQIPDEEEAS